MNDTAQAWKWQQFAGLDEKSRHHRLLSLGQRFPEETAVFNTVTDMLAYHGRLADLIPLLQTAWGQLQTSNRANEWQQQTLTALLTDSLVFQYLGRETGAKQPTALADLIEGLQIYIEIDPAGLSRYLDHLKGDTHYQWQLEHLEGHPPQNMAALLIEFLAYAHKQADQPYSRTNLLRQPLPTYFVERRTGQLNPREDLSDLMRRGRPIPGPPTENHPLVPDSETLQRFLGKLLNYEPVRPYQAAALYSLLPTWLNFLQDRKLLAPPEAADATTDLATLREHLLTYFESFDDPTLTGALKAWAK